MGCNNQKIIGIIFILSLLMLQSTCARTTIVVPAPAPQEAAPAKEEAPAPVKLNVEEIAIAPEIKDLAPISPGKIFEASMGKFYCFTRITGATRPVTVKHVWYYENERAAEIPILVTSPDFRTYSSKIVRLDQKGIWRVEVIDENGASLGTVEFTLQ